MIAIVGAAASFGFTGLTLWAINQVHYELREDALCIEYFGRCVRRVPYSDIESVQRGAPVWREHYNRFSRDPNICLRLRRGALSKNLVINPPHTEDFITQLRLRLRPA